MASRAQHLEHAVIHRHHGKTVDVEHTQEKLVILLLVEQVVAADTDFATDRGLDDDGLVEILTHRVDELFDIGVLETGRILVACAEPTIITAAAMMARCQPFPLLVMLGTTPKSLF